MEKGWYLKPNQNLIFKKRLFFVSWIFNICGFKKTSVQSLYSMIKFCYLDNENIKAFRFPIEHDNFPKPVKYPFYYRIINDWKIDRKSAKYLKDGPLFSENTEHALVHSKIFVESMPSLFCVWFARLILLLGLISSLITIWMFVSSWV